MKASQFGYHLDYAVLHSERGRQDIFLFLLMRCLVRLDALDEILKLRRSLLKTTQERLRVTTLAHVCKEPRAGENETLANLVNLMVEAGFHPQPERYAKRYEELLRTMLGIIGQSLHNISPGLKTSRCTRGRSIPEIHRGEGPWKGRSHSRKALRKADFWKLPNKCPEKRESFVLGFPQGFWERDQLFFSPLSPRNLLL